MCHLHLTLQMAHCEPAIVCVHLCCFRLTCHLLSYYLTLLCIKHWANLRHLHLISKIFPMLKRQSQKMRCSILRSIQTRSFPDAVKTTEPVQPASQPCCGRQMKPQTCIKYLPDCMLLCKMHGEPQGHALAGLVCIAPFAMGQV